MCQYSNTNGYLLISLPYNGFYGKDDPYLLKAGRRVSYTNMHASVMRRFKDKMCALRCSGKFTWRVKNFELFREMIKVQKIMSPPFAAGDCSLRISVYQSPVNSSEHLSLCLESKVSC